MKTDTKIKQPEIVLRNGKPRYPEDGRISRNAGAFRKFGYLKMLEEMRKKPLKFRKLNDFLADYKPHV